MATYYAQGVIDAIVADPRDHVPIDELRDMWPAIDLTAALVEVATSPGFEAIPESNQKALTARQRAGALWIGGQWKHYLTRTDYR